MIMKTHAHWDHLDGADIIAKATGATLVGNYESVRLMRANGVPSTQIVATAGGDTVDCGHGVTVRALPSQHSGLYAAGSPDSGQDCPFGHLSRGDCWRPGGTGRYMASDLTSA